MPAGRLNIVERVLFGVVAVVLIVAPFGTAGKFVSIAVFAALLGWSLRSQLFGRSAAGVDRKVAR